MKKHTITYAAISLILFSNLFASTVIHAKQTFQPIRNHYLDTTPMSDEMSALKERLIEMTSYTYTENELDSLDSSTDSEENYDEEYPSDHMKIVWNIYVKDLSSNEVICTGTTQQYAASLSKLFLMDYWMEQCKNDAFLLDNDNTTEQGTIRTLITDMIEISDNTAFNELLRIIAPDSVEDRFHMLNHYLKSSGYAQTGIYHALIPAETEFFSISEQDNYTTVWDCAKIMEKIYRGAAVDDENSLFLLEILEEQENTTKIPAGLPEGITVANKTGETDEVSHDVAIVFGPDTDYILCVMNTGFLDEGDSMQLISEISSEVFFTLNPSVDRATAKLRQISEEENYEFESESRH